jgi:Malectin domain
MAIVKMNGIAITTATKILGSTHNKVFGIDIDAGAPLVPTIVARINCGNGGAITATDGEMNWEGNTTGGSYSGVNYSMSTAIGTGGQFLTGGSFTKDPSIPSGLPTADYDSIKGSIRYGDYTWSFPHGNGTYKVQLYFADDNASATTGTRVYDFIFEGVTVDTGVDIFTEFGACPRVVMKEYDLITVSDGTLTFVTNSTTDLVLLMGIQVEKYI